MTPIITAISSLFFIASNYFPNLFEWGRQISEIANNLLVTPAGYAFTIWFPIFVGCLIFAWTSFRNWYPKNLLVGMSTIFILLWWWTTVVSFTDLYRLPPILFVVASVLLLYAVADLRKVSAIQSWRKYRCILIPLFMFVGWSNSAFWLNFGTIFTQYRIDIDPTILGVWVLLWLAAWQYGTTIYFKLPLATILTYLRATVAIVVALVTEWTNWVLLIVALLHMIGLCVVSYLAIHRKQY